MGPAHPPASPPEPWARTYEQYSHAGLQRPAPGDFRVQEQHGGRWEEAVPSAQVRRTTESILAQVRAPLLYARVDGLIPPGRFRLIELEILEPSLFLTRAPGAPERFTEALLEQLQADYPAPDARKAGATTTREVLT